MSNISSHVIVAAIDFGTTFSGYAFSFTAKPKEIMMNKSWGSNLGFQAYKTPSCVMVNSKMEFEAFGYEAEERYANEHVNEDEDTIHFHLFRHFKMLLHGTGKLTRDVKISAVDGQITSALPIFAMSLKYLKDHLISSVNQMIAGSVDETQVRWVLTVPAIWREEAKQFMREAAFQAGLIPNKDSRQLLIALEPECASIHCRSLPFDSGVDRVTFNAGCKYMIIDAGGGTIDLTCHEVLPGNNQVKEIQAASGGDWGGTKVDQNFINLLKEVLGANFIQQFMTDCAQPWLLFMIQFEKVKRPIKADGRSKIHLQLPYVMATKYQEICGKPIEKVFKETKKRGVSFSQGLLILNHDIVLELFLPVIRDIITHVTTMLQKPEMRHCEYIMLVGGFGENALLQKAIEDKFGSHIKLLVPEEAQMSVIKGAVLFGHNPQDIQIRKAQKTYGIDVTSDFNPSTHPSKYKYKNKDGFWKCEKLFYKFVTKNQDLKIGSSIKNTFSPTNKDDTHDFVSVFGADKENISYIDEPGCNKLGTLRIEMPHVEKGLDRRIEVEMIFSGTEIQVKALDVESGNTAQTNVDFL